MGNRVYLDIEKVYLFDGNGFSEKPIYQMRLFDDFDIFDAEIEDAKELFSILDIKNKEVMYEQLLEFVYKIVGDWDYEKFDEMINHCLEYNHPIIFGSDCIDSKILHKVFDGKPRLKGE